MVSSQKISNNCTCFESNTELTIRFEISNICTALLKNPVIPAVSAIEKPVWLTVWILKILENLS